MPRFVLSLASVTVLLAVGGCSLVFAPSRREGDAGAALDTPGLDAPLPDVPGLDAPLPDVPGADVPMIDAPGDAGPPCAGGLECVPAAPLGWSGPIVLVSGAGDVAPPSCPAMAPSTAFTTRSGLTAATPTCGCSCTPPASGPTCGSASLMSTNSSCITIGTTIASVADGACVTISPPTSGGWTTTIPPFSANGSTCTASPSSTVPPLAWDASHRACGFGTPAACGASSVCAPPRSAGERLCVYVDGDATCPAAFPERLDTAEDATDTRACSACSCGGVTGTCTGSIDIVDRCSGLPILYESVRLGGCAAAASYASPRASGNYTPNPSCPPSTVSPMGTATLTDVRTVCCVP